MAGSQGSPLAIAVANAGALGSLPCAMLSASAMHSELRAVRAASSSPINVNFFCHELPVANLARETAWQQTLRPYYDEVGLSMRDVVAAPARLPFNMEMAELLAEFKPEVVSFHFGLPARTLIERVKQWDAIVMSTATTVAEAKWLEDNGADVVIAQGFEAGGHRGMFLTDDITTQVGTMSLVPQVVDAVKVPVIAAGGIATANGVVAAMQLGASAVQVGTSFLLCPEAGTAPLHRAALTSDRVAHTAVSNVFTGRPARGLINRAMRKLGPMSEIAPAFPLASAAMFPLRKRFEERGRDDFSPLWAGQNASAAREMTAAELVEQLASAL